MNILIAGASGFIGHALFRSLKIDHHITALGRSKTKLQRAYSNAVTCCTWDELPQLDAKQFDAIINLCGFNIAASRWSNAIKKQVVDSRVSTSTILIHWLIKHQASS